MTVVRTTCSSCGTQPLEEARFCHACGSPIAAGEVAAEYKQVTVLFADVVHSMDIAAAVGAERLREIMAELVSRCTTVVQRYGGTVDKFTGDGVMALFGAPAALEDHAIRACLAALDIQRDAERLAADLAQRDGVDFTLRVGLNSGEVIAGEIGSGAVGYTAIGQQVGMAQRMESVAPAGGVMLSQSTARLVENTATLGEPQAVHIKGSDQPVPARRLLDVTERGVRSARGDPTLVGRQWEMKALAGMLDRSIDGHGCVVGVAGPAGIGKSRMVRELAALAADRGIDVFWTFCESHASEIPFRAVTRLLRAATAVSELDNRAARTQVRVRIPSADPEDLLLFDDLLGIAAPDAPAPRIDPDARRRRLTALVNATSLARTDPALYIVEDAHWIDEVSESMLADFLTVIPRTPSLMVITYRPEYRGALATLAGAQTIALAPLSDSETAALASQMLGPDHSIIELTRQVAQRAGGNPFFTEEIVRDLAERQLLIGGRGRYTCHTDVIDISVPVTLQATIAARIDRLVAAAKNTLNAAAVIGSRFSRDLLDCLVDSTALAELVDAELVDQVMFTPRAEYAFRHPLIRTVAYESQLKSDRAELHRRLAAAIEARGSSDENAALIGEHLEAAGDLPGAYSWHMRAGGWLINRNIMAARASWLRARQVADRLPDDDPQRTAMRIAPRTLLCGTAWRDGGSSIETDFDELRELCTAANDQRSLAIGMAGLVHSLSFRGDNSESTRLAGEHIRLLESIGDPTLTVALSFAAIYAKHETGEVQEAMQLAQRVIDVADGDRTRGDLIVASPLAWALVWRGSARWAMGSPEGTDDFDRAAVMARDVDPMAYAGAICYKYLGSTAIGGLKPDATALRETGEALAVAEQSGDDFTLILAQLIRGVVLIHCGGAAREDGFKLLAQVREAAEQGRFVMLWVPIAEVYSAAQQARDGDLNDAIECCRMAVDQLFRTGDVFWTGFATRVLVKSLLCRDADGDAQEALAAVERLQADRAGPRFVLSDVMLLRARALLARARGDEVAYEEFAERYRVFATSYGYEPDLATVEAMV